MKNETPIQAETAKQIQIGDVVMPPERELRLWMRRHIKEHNLPENALYLNVTGIYQSEDKGGAWLHFKTMYPDIWPGGAYSFTFKARPETPWTIIQKRAAANLNTVASDTVKTSTQEITSLPYKLGSPGDPHFQHEAEELSRTESTCDWYDNLRDDVPDDGPDPFEMPDGSTTWEGSLREDGRSDDQGESYSERNT